MSVVYISVKGTSYQDGYQILGVFHSENDAIKRCLEQSTFMLEKRWIKQEGIENHWTNGSTLFVKVITQKVM